MSLVLPVITGVSMLTTSALSFGLLQNAGDLQRNGSLQSNTVSGNLEGSYPDAVVWISAITLVLDIVCLAWYMYLSVAGCVSEDMRPLRIFFALVILLSLVNCLMNIVLVTEWQSLRNDGSVTIDITTPTDPASNWMIRGSYGIGLMVMASLTVGGIGIACLWAMGLLGMDSMGPRMSSTFDSVTSSPRRMGSSLRNRIMTD